MDYSQKLLDLKNRLYTLCHALFSSSWVCPGADPGYGTSQCSLLPYYYLLKQKLTHNFKIKHFSCETQVELKFFPEHLCCIYSFPRSPLGAPQAMGRLKTIPVKLRIKTKKKGECWQNLSGSHSFDFPRDSPSFSNSMILSLLCFGVIRFSFVTFSTAELFPVWGSLEEPFPQSETWKKNSMSMTASSLGKIVILLKAILGYLFTPFQGYNVNWGSLLFLSATGLSCCPVSPSHGLVRVKEYHFQNTWIRPLLCIFV